LSIALVAQYLGNGQLRALGVGSKQRVPEFPNLPTIDESGVPGFEAVSWFGLFAPKATPAEVVHKINTDVQKIFADPGYREKFLAPNYFNITPGGPAEFAAYIDAEAAKWSKVIKSAHLHVD
jgi:tripartite-type tricarboxylate transporter receptor subunit TctC